MTTTSVSAVSESQAQPSRRMIDAPTRVFHWLLALSFVGAYATSDGERWRLVHITLGYTMIGLVGFRLIWLLLGPKPARWTAWAARFRALMGSVKAAQLGQFKWPALQAGLNTLAIVALLAAVVLTTASGYVLDQEWLGDWFEEVHEVAGNALLAFVLGHLAVVLVGAVIKSDNPLRLMVTGRAPGRGPDLVPRNRIWLGALILAAVLGFWWTQRQAAPAQAPDGDVLVQANRPSDDHDDDDD